MKKRKKNLDEAFKNKDFEYKFITSYDRRNLQTEIIKKFENIEKKFIANFMSPVEIDKTVIDIFHESKMLKRCFIHICFNNSWLCPIYV